jgi:5-formyltetrahydrofolate cyclo-ligase
LSELIPPPAGSGWEQIRAWRKQTRTAFIAQRMALPAPTREAEGERARERLVQEVDLSRFQTIGIYWPIRGEIDVRELARKHILRGGRIGLPVCVQRSAPVEFWNWQPGTGIKHDFWGIPIPIERDPLQPDALIGPLVGYDAAGYRLGYGGGYYDRTLAAAASKPFCVGFGYSRFALQTIWPQPHDIPMDVIITDAARP